MKETVNPNPKTLLSLMKKKLPHGTQTKISRKLGVSKDAVQCAFRGLAGEALTKKVLTQAKKNFSTEELEQFELQAAAQIQHI